MPANLNSKRRSDPPPPFPAGQRVPFSGIYQVLHYSHRVTHELTMIQGAFFPSCRGCGEQVRFISLRTADRLHEDYDFSEQGASRPLSAAG